MNFSIIIPIYNEKQNIEKLVEEIFLYTDTKFNFEIIIVDDYSSDGSKDILKEKFISKNNFIVIYHNKNMGQSASILTGIKKSKYENILTIDGDLQNDPKDINKLLYKYFNHEYDLVAGIREKRKDNFIKIISSVIANKIRSFVLRDNCKDTGCSLKVFNKKVFLEFPFFDGIHRFLPALFNGYKKKISFINVNHRPRLSGKSNYGTFNRLFKGIYDTIRVYKIINKRND